MEETKYLISEMAKKVEVETHVLRYWEEELKLPVRRNEIGHRYYTPEDVERFKEIKKLKEKGLQLRAIKTVLYDEKNNKVIPVEKQFTGGDDKIQRLQMLLKHMIKEAIKESGTELVEELRTLLTKELDYQFRLFGEEEDSRYKESVKREEEHYKKIDELLRSTMQKETKRKKHSLF